MAEWARTAIVALIANPITTSNGKNRLPTCSFADLNTLRLPPEAAIVDLMDFLGDAKSCSKFIAGELIYRDAVHLRRNLAPDVISSLAHGFTLSRCCGGLRPRDESRKRRKIP